jgi:hypothetical protein
VSSFGFYHMHDNVYFTITFLGGVSAQRSPSQLPLAPAQPSRVPEAEVHTATHGC